MVNLLVPRNLEGRKEKLKQMNTKLLSQEMIDGDIRLDESFMDIDAKFIKVKKVIGNVLLYGGWTEIPAWLKDVEVNGDFNCSFNKLTTLENCPQKIGGGFYCFNNSLITLEGCPKIIKDNFSCSSNQLSSLEGCPEKIGAHFYCYDNKVEFKLPDYVDLKYDFCNITY